MLQRWDIVSSALCLMYRSPWRGNVRPRRRNPVGKFNHLLLLPPLNPLRVRLVCDTQPRPTSCFGATTRSVRITMPRHAGVDREGVWACTAPSRSPAASGRHPHHLPPAPTLRCFTPSSCQPTTRSRTYPVPVPDHRLPYVSLGDTYVLSPTLLDIHS